MVKVIHVMLCVFYHKKKKKRKIGKPSSPCQTSTQLPCMPPRSPSRLPCLFSRGAPAFLNAPRTLSLELVPGVTSGGAGQVGSPRSLSFRPRTEGAPWGRLLTALPGRCLQDSLTPLPGRGCISHRPPSGLLALLLVVKEGAPSVTRLRLEACSGQGRCTVTDARGWAPGCSAT